LEEEFGSHEGHDTAERDQEGTNVRSKGINVLLELDSVVLTGFRASVRGRSSAGI
jgi:hypothetical protein